MSAIVPKATTTKEIPARFADLMDYNKKCFAFLATAMPEGSPQVTPVWFDMSGDKVRVNTAKGRVKERNMKKGSRVALSIMDPDKPYRSIQIRGTVISATEQGADQHIDLLTKKYMARDKYPFRAPGEIRVMYEIKPTSVATWD